MSPDDTIPVRVETILDLLEVATALAAEIANSKNPAPASEPLARLFGISMRLSRETEEGFKELAERDHEPNG